VGEGEEKREGGRKHKKGGRGKRDIGDKQKKEGRDKKEGGQKQKEKQKKVGPEEGGPDKKLVRQEGTEQDDKFSGSEGDDLYFGKGGNDAIYGNGGNDRLYGEGDNDFLSGGKGNDVLYGGSGVDFLYGDEDNDELYGGDGGDYLYGGDGVDILKGGLGLDTLNGGRGNDILYGEEGGDRLYGWFGDDVIRGGMGEDHLRGEEGDDILYGGVGDDVLSGGLGSDKLYGGLGNDEYNIFYDHTDGVDIIWDEGGDNDVLKFDFGELAIDAGRIAFVRDGDDLKVRFSMDGKEYEATIKDWSHEANRIETLRLFTSQGGQNVEKTYDLGGYEFTTTPVTASSLTEITVSPKKSPSINSLSSDSGEEGGVDIPYDDEDAGLLGLSHFDTVDF
jgi:Ca2+-binding RTX toxin-like protein